MKPIWWVAVGACLLSLWSINSALAERHRHDESQWYRSYEQIVASYQAGRSPGTTDNDDYNRRRQQPTQYWKDRNEWKAFITLADGTDSPWRAWIFEFIPVFSFAFILCVAYLSILISGAPAGFRWPGAVILVALSVAATLVWPDCAVASAVLIVLAAAALAPKPWGVRGCCKVIIPVVFVVIGTHSVIHTCRVYLEFDGRYPLLTQQPLESEVLRALLAANKTGSAQDLESATQAIDQQTAKSRDPISVNLHWMEWTICFCFFLAGWWFVNSSALGYGRIVRMTFVLTLYLLTGCAFGVLYYDVYAIDLAKQNLVADLNEAYRRVDPKAAAAAGQASDFLELSRRWKATNQAESTILMLRLHYWSSSVFAEDKPVVSLESTHSERTDPLFACSFVFSSRSYRVKAKDPLPLVCPWHRQCGGESSATNRDAEAAGRRPATINPGTIRTNADSEADLDCFLDEMASASYPQGRVTYNVEVSGGADRRRLLRTTPELINNLDLSERRALEALRIVRKHVIVLLKNKPEHDEESVHLRYLDAAMSRALIRHQDIQSYSSDPYDDQWRALWPDDSLPAAKPPAEDADEWRDAPWRAARVTITKTVPDRASAPAMTMGLASAASLADMLYFSFASFTTTGYGDIKPVSDPIRFWAMMENILEILFTAVFFATSISND